MYLRLLHIRFGYLQKQGADTQIPRPTACLPARLVPAEVAYDCTAVVCANGGMEDAGGAIPSVHTEQQWQVQQQHNPSIHMIACTSQFKEPPFVEAFMHSNSRCYVLVCVQPLPPISRPWGEEALPPPPATSAWHRRTAHQAASTQRAEPQQLLAQHGTEALIP